MVHWVWHMRSTRHRLASSPGEIGNNSSWMVFGHVFVAMEKNCLVVTGTMEFYDFPIYWEFHHPIWRTPWFFRGVGIPPTRWLLWTIKDWLHGLCCWENTANSKNIGSRPLLARLGQVASLKFNLPWTLRPGSRWWMTGGTTTFWCNIKGKLQIEFHESSWELPNQLSMATIAMLVYQRILFTFGQFTMFGVVFLRRSPNREDSPGECDVAQADWTGLAYPGDRSASERWRLFYERLNAECDEVPTDHQIVFLFYQWIKYTTGMYIRSVSKTLCPLIVKL